MKMYKSKLPLIAIVAHRS